MIFFELTFLAKSAKIIVGIMQETHNRVSSETPYYQICWMAKCCPAFLKVRCIFMQEIWKKVTVEPFSECYEVSNLGRVRSVDREVKRKREPKTFVQGSVLVVYLII